MATIHVISPHRDDGALSAGLAIQLLSEAGHRVVMVNCWTRSDFCPYAEGEGVSRVSALREAEDRQFAALVGGLTVMDLGRTDAPLRLHVSVNDVRLRGRLSSDDLAEVETLSATLGGIVTNVAIFPLALGDHIDHSLALEAALRCRASGWRLGFYEDLPYAAELQECCVEAAARRLSRRLGERLWAATAQAEGADRMKARLIGAYPSQISESQAAAIREYTRRRQGERLWLTSDTVSLLFPQHHGWAVCKAREVQPFEALRCALHRQSRSSRAAAGRVIRAMRAMGHIQQEASNV